MTGSLFKQKKHQQYAGMERRHYKDTGEKVTSYKLRKRSLRMNPLTPWLWTSSLQDCEKIHFCRFANLPMVFCYGALATNTDASSGSHGKQATSSPHKKGGTQNSSSDQWLPSKSKKDWDFHGPPRFPGWTGPLTLLDNWMPKQPHLWQGCVLITVLKVQCSWWTFQVTIDL